MYSIRRKKNTRYRLSIVSMITLKFQRMTGIRRIWRSGIKSPIASLEASSGRKESRCDSPSMMSLEWIRLTRGPFEGLRLVMLSLDSSNIPSRSWLIFTDSPMRRRLPLDGGLLSQMTSCRYTRGTIRRIKMTSEKCTWSIPWINNHFNYAS